MNIILADCEAGEILSLAKGLESVTRERFFIKNLICNYGHSNFILNSYRYFSYAIFPFRQFLQRKKYKYVLGWQQFFTLFYVFYSNCFYIKKCNITVVCNFTYKNKAGMKGKLYKKFMQYCIKSPYLDYIHVLGESYVGYCCKELGAEKSKFIVTPFGVEDICGIWKNSVVGIKNYALALGRSNRDYSFLIEAWKSINHPLVIICDTLHVKEELPGQIQIINNVTGDAQFPWLMNCTVLINPILDSAVCSGDTVLVNGMMFSKPVVVTKPSTLSEMYIEDGVDGICIEKKLHSFRVIIADLITDSEKCNMLGINARKKYLNQFSRFSMGLNLGKYLTLSGLTPTS